VSYSGFVNTDGTNVLSGSPLLTSGAVTNSPVGSYVITNTLGSLVATNYTVNLANGSLSVTGAVLTATANNASRAYGQTNPVFTVSYSGFVNTDGTNVLSGSPLLTSGAVTNSPVGSYVITNTLGSLVATNYTVNLANGSLSVTGAVLTATANNGVTANNKVYDGTTAATINLSNANLTGVVGGDMVTLSTNGYTANFATANVGTNISVSVSGLTLSGSGASNYTLVQPVVLAANITPKPLTIGSTLPQPVITSIVLTNGVVTLKWSSTNGGIYRVQYITSLNGGGWTDLSPDVTATGPTAIQTNSIGNATQRFYRVKMLNSGLSANDKVYDGTTAASLSPNSVVLVGVINGDNVSLVTNGYTANFATANVGTSIPVTVSGLTLSGASAGNYTLMQPTGLNANITGKVITISSGPPPLITSVQLNNGLVTITWNSVTGGIYRVQYNTSLNGGGWTNLSPDVTATGLTATQTNYVGSGPIGYYRVGVLNAGIVANDKVYDGTAVATISSNNVVLLGVVNGDSVGLSTNGYTASFATPNVGTAIPVTLSGLTLTGASAADYTLAPLGGLTANIMPATLTVSADNYSRTYGLPNPPLTFSYSGFVNGEGTNVLFGAPGLSTTATISSPAGPYAITTAVGTLSAANYMFNLINGTLTVVPLPQLSSVLSSGNQLTLTWPTITNQTYQLESTTNLATGIWIPVGGPVLGTGGSIMATNSLGVFPQQFFKLTLNP
jgi:phosphotransferase system HPr-like phosphotransfer protein